MDATRHGNSETLRHMLPVLLFLLLLLTIPGTALGDAPQGSGGPKVCNVVDYGAVGDGVTKDTAAIARAVSDCSTAAAPLRRAVVLFPGPNRRYLTGTFNVSSDLVIKVGANATILGVPPGWTVDPADYPIVPALPSYGRSRDIWMNATRGRSRCRPRVFTSASLFRWHSR